MAEGIPTFDLAGPPRHVPLTVKLRVLFGGFSNQFGWLFFGFGMVFVWIFLPRADFSFLTFRGEIKTTKGQITACKDTNFSEGGSKHSKGRPVYAYHYAYTDEAGTEHEGVSYSTAGKKEVGRPMDVEYLADEPATSRIKGMRRAPMPPFVLFVLVFPIVGWCFIMVGFRKGLKGINLLVGGTQGRGTLKDKQPTNTRVNKQTVYKYTFEFEADDGLTYTVTARTHETAKFEDEEEEPLLYDPLVPLRAVLMDDLPGQPRIDENGHFQAGGAVGTVVRLFVPLASILGHGGWALWTLVG